MKQLLSEFAGDLADAVFPRRCYLCGAAAPDGLACSEHSLPAGLPGPRCGTCARALPEVVPGGALCAACRLHSPGFRALVALADYRAQPICRPWLFALKYGGRRDLGLPLGLALGAAWLERAPLRLRRKPLLVPVPLHWRRRLERGFDQARALTEHASRAAAIPWAAALFRRRATGVQGGPGAPSRTANVRGAFGVRRSRWCPGSWCPRSWFPGSWFPGPGGLPRGQGLAGASGGPLDPGDPGDPGDAGDAGARTAPGPRRPAVNLAGRDVWLVDDVVTSGATVAECARVLRREGAATVSVLALARAGTGGGGGAGTEVGWAP